jgi:transcriptional regulator with XRE-family HTH domain
MGKPTPVVPSRSEALGQALKSLRWLRGRRPGEMADLIGISRRSYEYFEAGRGPLNVDRVHRFAQILDVDPFAILAAMEIRSPQFAVRCAEHKLMTVMMVAVQEFDAAVTTRTDPNVIRHLTAIARHRGRTKVTLTGAPAFRREAWLIARAEGLEVRGYRPTARDAQDLARRIDAQRRREAWAKLNQDLDAARAHPDRDRRRAGAKSRLEVVDAVVKSRIPDPAVQARLLDQARARIAGWLERGAKFDQLDLNGRRASSRDRQR